MVTKSISIPGASIKSVNLFPAENEPTSVLVLHAPLTLALADALRCRDMVFTINDQPRKFDGAFGLPIDHGDDEVDLKLPMGSGALETVRPTKLWKFRVSHETDLKLGVDFRAHFKGQAEMQILQDLISAHNTDPFDLAILATQGELFPEPVQATQDGKRVDMSPAPSEQADDLEVAPTEEAILTESVDVAGIGIQPIPEGQPNEHGVYTCESHFDLEFFGKNCGARIDLLCIAPGQWISATFATTKSSGAFSAPMKADRIFPSLEMAVAWESFHAEAHARRSINTTGKAGAKAWQSITEWFHRQFASQAAALGLDSVEALEDAVTRFDSDSAADALSDESLSVIPADPGAAEWRTAEEIAAGIPHHISGEVVQ